MMTVPPLALTWAPRTPDRCTAPRVGATLTPPSATTRSTDTSPASLRTDSPLSMPMAAGELGATRTIARWEVMVTSMRAKRKASPGKASGAGAAAGAAVEVEVVVVEEVEVVVVVVASASVSASASASASAVAAAAAAAAAARTAAAAMGKLRLYRGTITVRLAATWHRQGNQSQYHAQPSLHDGGGRAVKLSCAEARG